MALQPDLLTNRARPPRGHEGPGQNPSELYALRQAPLHQIGVLHGEGNVVEPRVPNIDDGFADIADGLPAGKKGAVRKLENLRRETLVAQDDLRDHLNRSQYAAEEFD